MTDQCPVIEVIDENTITVYSPILNKNFDIKVDEQWMDAINDSDTQVYLNIDINRKCIVEE